MASQAGRPDVGYRAPDRNIIGVMTIWMTGMTDWTLATRAPSSRPKAVIESEARKRTPSSSIMRTGE